MQNDKQNEQDNYQVWMENAGFLYDRLFVQKLKWPSLTFQWLPYQQQTNTETIYRCIHATHSSGNAQSEHIYISEVIFPTMRQLHEDPTDMPASRMKPLFRFTHQLEVNKARHNPSDPSQIAARTDEGPICLFKEGNEYPIHLLDGNLNGGFALEWSQYGILSGDFEGQAFYWYDDQGKVEISTGENIQDIKTVQRDLAVMVGDSGYISFWDMRANSIVHKSNISDHEKRQVYSVSVNPTQNNLILTAGEDQAVKIWDRRNLSAQLHKFQGHEDKIMSVQWSTVNSSIFASGSLDKKVKIWDLMRVGFQIPKDLGGTDELLFTHEGHKGGINDISWNSHELLLGSVEEDENTIQFYSITNNIHELEYAEDLDYLKEQCFS